MSRIWELVVHCVVCVLGTRGLTILMVSAGLAACSQAPERVKPDEPCEAGWEQLIACGDESDPKGVYLCYGGKWIPGYNVCSSGGTCDLHPESNTASCPGRSEVTGIQDSRCFREGERVCQFNFEYVLECRSGKWQQAEECRSGLCSLSESGYVCKSN
jgi:hypothetical protein